MANQIFSLTIRMHLRAMRIALTINADRLDDLRRIVIHKDDICRLNSRVGAKGSHRYTQVCNSQNRRVVDSVADKSKRGAGTCLGVLLSNELLHMRHFVFRQELRMYLIKAHFLRHAFRHRSDIAGQHDCLHNACLLQCTDGFRGSRLNLVGDDYMADVGKRAIHSSLRHIYNGPHMVAGFTFDVQLTHQFEISCCNLYPVDNCDHALAADFLHIRHPALVQFYAACLIRAPDARGNGVRGVALRQRGELQDLGGVHIHIPPVVDRRNLEI